MVLQAALLQPADLVGATQGAPLRVVGRQVGPLGATRVEWLPVAGPVVERPLAAARPTPELVGEWVAVRRLAARREVRRLAGRAAVACWCA